jgi:hypothetical protein
MQFKRLNFLLVVLLLAVFVQYSTAQTITANKTGSQGGYYYEYWKDNGTGTMILGDGGNFSCSWSNINNILFRKGLRPGLFIHLQSNRQFIFDGLWVDEKPAHRILYC